MGNKIYFYTILIFSVASCTAENVNISPATTNISAALNSTSKTSVTSYSDRIDDIGYASEITNLCASLPKFSNKKVNSELGIFKYTLKEYIGALQAHNKIGMKRAYRDYEKAYKKLQTLKTQLNADEAYLLNRYLVLIKTNMSNLQDNTQQ